MNKQNSATRKMLQQWLQKVRCFILKCLIKPQKRERKRKKGKETANVTVQVGWLTCIRLWWRHCSADAWLLGSVPFWAGGPTTGDNSTAPESWATANSGWAGRTAARTWRSRFVAERRHGEEKGFLVCFVFLLSFFLMYMRWTCRNTKKQISKL